MDVEKLSQDFSPTTSMFNIFWDEFIYPTMLNVFEEVDPEFKAACGMRFSYETLDEYRQALHRIYREKREWLKEIYMPHAKSPVLDIHKLGAVICRAIIGHKPFAFDFRAAEKFVINKFKNSDKQQNTDWFFANIYANYKVAFYASIGVSFMNILYRCRQANDTVSLHYFMDNPYWTFYESDGSHECFENSCMIALQKNDVLGRSFDYFGYAIMLYQLEQHNYPTKIQGSDETQKQPDAPPQNQQVCVESVV